MYRLWKRLKEVRSKQPLQVLSTWICNVECNKIDGENIEILKENDQVEKKSARVIQGCSNYETLAKDQALMHILDHEANLEGQGSIKSRNYRIKWKLKYP